MPRSRRRPSRRGRSSGLGGRIARAAAVLAAVAVAGAALLVFSTLPRRSGRARVRGIAAAVRIETDARGVPTIRATTIEDALFGLGWVHARDRLWQLEFQRRVGSGRLAEALGGKLLSTDRFLRTVGFRRSAEESLKALSPEARARLAAYRSGINAWLASSSVRPVEARILRISIAPFDDADCAVWLKMMAWDLSGNATAEIRRARLTAAIGAERTAELYATAPDTPTILRDGEWVPPPAPSAAPGPAAGRDGVVSFAAGAWPGLAAAFASLDRQGFGGESVGSNSWVVSGARSLSGRPILANDPHLGLRAPGVFYIARLVTPGLSVVGATLPGVPGVVIGKNDRIAWALTALEPDVEDLFVERTDPADASRYVWKGRSIPFATRTETIRVRGGTDVKIEIRSTVHGPVVTDVLSGAERLGSAVALRWTGLDPLDRSLESVLALDTARDWAGFLDAASLLRCPSMNLLYADADGHIGYTATGAIPLRPRADGLLPVSGEGADDWTGTVPFSSLPRTLDPPRGYIVTANHRVVSDSYPFSFTRDPVEPYRARRIEDRLTAVARLSTDAMRSIQQDRVSYQANDVVPLLLDTAPSDDASRDALARLRGWNREFAPESVPATIYAAWYAELSTMPEDEIGEPAAAGVRSRFLLRALAGDSAWCDDVRTPRRETCADFKTATLARALALLRSRLGPEVESWRWERLHRARFPHAVFVLVPLLSRLFSLETGQGGDGSTVNVGAYRRDGSFRMTDGPSYRQIIDLGDPAASRFVGTTGQSGNPFESGYRDFLPLWRDGKDFEIGRGPPGKVFALEPAK